MLLTVHIPKGSGATCEGWEPRSSRVWSSIRGLAGMDHSFLTEGGGGSGCKSVNQPKTIFPQKNPYSVPEQVFFSYIFSFLELLIYISTVGIDCRYFPHVRWWFIYLSLSNSSLSKPVFRIRKYISRIRIPGSVNPKYRSEPRKPIDYGSDRIRNRNLIIYRHFEAYWKSMW